MHFVSTLGDSTSTFGMKTLPISSPLIFRLLNSSSKDGITSFAADPPASHFSGTVVMPDPINPILERHQG
jgi:hypothetical protein